jgi:hypothetical protein
VNWKKFLKPDWKKIVVFVVIFGLVGFLVWPSFIWATDTPTSIGFPFTFYVPEFRWGPVYSPARFSVSFLTLDIIFGYLISCLIIWIYDKRKKKS